MHPQQSDNIKFQRTITIVGFVLFIAKIVAWYLTNSISILTDALESTVNVIAGAMGWYSLYLSAKPRDANHPYGHGKVEFITAGIEGGMIITAGCLIIYEAINNFKNPHIISKLDIGILIIVLAALVNFYLGYNAIKRGRKQNSLALVSSGKHLLSDTYTTVGIVIGLIILYFTKIPMIDSIVALIFALLIIFTGYKIIREAISGIMDEADASLLQKILDLLNKHKRENWIDLHNLRVIKYGAVLHIDCHLTVPWYFNIKEGHTEVDVLDNLIKQEFGNSVELFVHSDACLPFSCAICNKQNCIQRVNDFVEAKTWTLERVLSNEKMKL